MLEEEGRMIEERFIPKEFFAKPLTVEEEMRLLHPLRDRPEIREALIEELVAVATQTHPGNERMTAAAQQALQEWTDSQSEEVLARAGFLPAIMIQQCDESQRIAAVRTLRRLLPDDNAFQGLWQVATFGSSRVSDEAARVVADDLPNHAEELLEAYRAPYAMVTHHGATYENTGPKIAAFRVLVLGIGRCDLELQDKIRRTVTFRCEGSVHREYKYGDSPDCRVRNDVIRSFQTDGYGNPELSMRIHWAIHEHFLEDFLQVFIDDGSLFTEAVYLALAWQDDPRVIDAFAGYLDAWGGTFLSGDVTEQIVLSQVSMKETLITPRFAQAIELLERKPMDAPWEGMKEGKSPPSTFVGEYTAKQIRSACAQWREARLPACHP